MNRVSERAGTLKYLKYYRCACKCDTCISHPQKQHTLCGAISSPSSRNPALVEWSRVPTARGMVSSVIKRDYMLYVHFVFTHERIRAVRKDVVWVSHEAGISRAHGL